VSKDDSGSVQPAKTTGEDDKEKEAEDDDDEEEEEYEIEDILGHELKNVSIPCFPYSAA
jgi:hypothetical protein